MKRSAATAVVTGLSAALVAFVALRAAAASEDEDAPTMALETFGDPGDEFPGTDATARAAYQAHLAANDAAAERWRAAHGTSRPDTPPDEPAPDTYGCPEGTQYWQRDRITELCAPLCTGDQDCGPEDGRCRLLDVEERDDAAPIVLVDETPVEEIEAVELGETRQAPPIRVCDPFWDIEGATDADLVAVAE